MDNGGRALMANQVSRRKEKGLWEEIQGEAAKFKGHFRVE